MMNGWIAFVYEEEEALVIWYFIIELGMYSFADWIINCPTPPSILAMEIAEEQQQF